MSSLNGAPTGKHHHTVADPTAFAHATNIDRRQCSRTVPLELLCLGLGRTGTNSLREALITLGYYDVYHYAAVMQENPRDAEMWNEAFDGKYGSKKKPFQREDWDQLLGHCMATTDAPCYLFSKELVEAYPDAKVILTTRDTPEQWWKSIDKTLLPYMRFIDSQSLIARFVRTFAPESPVTIEYINWCGDVYLRKWNTKEKALQKYDQHNSMIRDLAKGKDFLEFNVKEGWEPLCKFLGKPIPDEPFPRTNSTEQMVENVHYLSTQMLKFALVNFGLSTTKIVLPVAAIALGVLWYRWSSA